MKKVKKLTIILFLTFLFNSFPSLLMSSAAEKDALSIEEVDGNQLTGTYSGSGKITISLENNIIGEANVTKNTLFTIHFNQPIETSSVLTITATDQNGYTDSKSIIYQPPIVVIPNNKQTTMKGSAIGSSSVQAYIGNQQLKLVAFNSQNGNFEFTLPPSITTGSIIKVISIKDNIKNSTYIKVLDAPAPSPPNVNLISNKSTTISGTAELRSKVFLLLNGKWQSISLQNSPSFKMPLKAKLTAGTRISAYVMDSRGKKSKTITVTVVDKIPPKTPKINSITNKSFAITGKTEAKAKVYIVKNKKLYGTVNASASGTFRYRIPLHAKQTKFEIYATDKAGNKSKATKVTVRHKKRPSKKVLKVPVTRQMPELPRGCEVTSLSMLLSDSGVKVNKMTLATKIKKDPTNHAVKNGKIYFGNPNFGFVGNMYTFSKPGLGVYHQPITALAKQYLPNRIVDLSGKSFDNIQNYVAAGHPVWVVTTSWFSYVPSRYWITWYTPTGRIKITYKEHSVLITGYDAKYVYVNDPLDGRKNKKLPKKAFIEGWQQFGNQAVSYF